MMIQNFLSRKAVAIHPSAVTLAEFQNYGWTQEDIDKALKNGTGYNFDWGHIVEQIFERAQDHKHGYIKSVTWYFCLDKMLAKFHQAGGNLGELSELSLNYIGRLKRQGESSWPVELSDDDSFEAFSLGVSTDDNTEYGEKKINDARCWIAEIFLVKHLPSLIQYLDNVNASAEL